MGEANTALRAKGEECSKLAAERNLLAAQLAEQRELLKKAQDEAEKRETALLAEFESERSSWTDKEAQLTAGFGSIEDMVDSELLLFSFFESLASIQADCRFLTFGFLALHPNRLLPRPLRRREPGHRGLSPGAEGRRRADCRQRYPNP